MSDAPPSKLDRRRFLKRGLVGGGLLVLAGTLPFALRSTLRRRPRGELRLLSADEYAVFAAAAARLAPGDGAGPRWPTAEALDCAGKIDALMARVHPDVGKRLQAPAAPLREQPARRASSPARRGRSPARRPAEQDARLEAWRRSRVAVLRSGYQALKRLAHATYYSSPEVYAPHRLPRAARRAGGARMTPRAPGASSAGAELPDLVRRRGRLRGRRQRRRAAAWRRRCWRRRAPRSPSSRRAGTTRAPTSTCRSPGPTRRSTRSTATARPRTWRS